MSQCFKCKRTDRVVRDMFLPTGRVIALCYECATLVAHGASVYGEYTPRVSRHPAPKQRGEKREAYDAPALPSSPFAHTSWGKK